VIDAGIARIVVLVLGVGVAADLSAQERPRAECQAARLEAPLLEAFRAINPVIGRTTVLDLRVAHPPASHVALGWGIRADRRFEGDLHDELFGVFAVDGGCSRIERVLGVFPTSRWLDYRVRIDSLSPREVVVVGAGATYGDAPTRRVFAVDGPSASPPGSSQATGDVEAAARTFLSAFNGLDMPAFLDCFADDATVIHPPSGPPRTFPKRLQGKTEIARTFQIVFDEIRRASGRSTPPYQNIQPQELLVQHYDDVAIATFHLGTDARRGRRTLVFRRLGGDWKIVHLHASVFDVEG
jgi:ketosteroid isomerase-like protein